MDKRPPKKYKFKFSAVLWLLIALGLLLGCAGFAFTVWQFVGFLEGDISSVYEWMKYLLLFLTSILLAVLLLAMIVRSQYVLDDEKITLQFGIIKTTYYLKDIYSVHLFKGSGKLAVYFDDFKTKYVIIVVKESWYDDFIKSLLERKESIAFTFSTFEEEEAAKKK